MSLLLLFAGATTGQGVPVEFPAVVRTLAQRLTPIRTASALTPTRDATRLTPMRSLSSED